MRRYSKERAQALAKETLKWVTEDSANTSALYTQGVKDDIRITRTPSTTADGMRIMEIEVHESPTVTRGHYAAVPLGTDKAQDVLASHIWSAMLDTEAGSAENAEALEFLCETDQDMLSATDGALYDLVSHAGPDDVAHGEDILRLYLECTDKTAFRKLFAMLTGHSFEGYLMLCMK